VIRPKWGFYRALDDAHQPSDWQLFQNIQIWKKDESSASSVTDRLSFGLIHLIFAIIYLSIM
jgi:hypothetical protein